LGLLASQASGLHMHVDARGYVGIPEGTHVHGMAVHAHDGTAPSLGGESEYVELLDPDHQDDRDVSVVELGAGASKLLIFLICFSALLVIIPRLGGRIRVCSVAPAFKTRRGRWRPPLRGPPLFSHSLSHCTR
jgi:hypothetical protein